MYRTARVWTARIEATRRARRREEQNAALRSSCTRPTSAVTRLGLPDGKITRAFEPIAQRHAPILTSGRRDARIAPYERNGHPDNDAVGAVSASDFARSRQASRSARTTRSVRGTEIGPFRRRWAGQWVKFAAERRREAGQGARGSVQPQSQLEFSAAREPARKRRLHGRSGARLRGLCHVIATERRTASSAIRAALELCGRRVRARPPGRRSRGT